MVIPQGVERACSAQVRDANPPFLPNSDVRILMSTSKSMKLARGSVYTTIPPENRVQARPCARTFERRKWPRRVP